MTVTKKTFIFTMIAFIVGICVAIGVCFLFMRSTNTDYVPSPQIVQTGAPVNNMQGAGNVPMQNVNDAVIDMQRAKAIAFQHAGIAENMATLLELKPDVEDGKNVFEVKFTANDNKYKYEILQTSGAIYSYEYENDRWLAPIGINNISLEEAKAKVLSHAGLAFENVQFSKLETDFDDGVSLYEIDFLSGNCVYSYEITLSGVMKKCKVKIWQ